MLRALILEDDDDLSVSWQIALEQVGMDVIAVKAADDAIALLGEGRYDVVISDVLIRHKHGGFDNRGGLTLLSHIRLNIAERPVTVAVSGASDDIPVLQLAEQLHADVALRKPFFPDELVTEVLAQLSRHRSAGGSDAPGES